LPLTRAGPAESMEAATVVAAVFIIEDLLVMIAPSGIDRPKVDRLRAGAHLSNGPAPQVTAPGRTSLSPLAEAISTPLGAPQRRARAAPMPRSARLCRPRENRSGCDTRAGPMSPALDRSRPEIQ